MLEHVNKLSVKNKTLKYCTSVREVIEVCSFVEVKATWVTYAKAVWFG